MKHASFFGLTEDGVEAVLEEYDKANYEHNLSWTVVAAGHNEDGFWLILARTATSQFKQRVLGLPERQS